MKIGSYNKFWHRMHAYAKDNFIPLRVMFEITYECNFKCKYCYIRQSYKSRNKELTTEEIYSILRQLKKIGCYYLGFTGGEPFIRKDILDVLKYAKNLGFEIIIYTNGSLINKNTMEQLFFLRPNKIDITIPAMGREVFEKITGVKGSYNKVFNAVSLLHKNKINLGFKTCLLKDNRNEIDEIQKFSKSLNVYYRLTGTLSAKLDGSEEPFRYGCEPSLTDNFISVDRHKQNNSCELINNFNKNRIFKCGAGVSQAAITPFGELKTCIKIDCPKYKILDSSLKNCWENLRKSIFQPN